MSRYTAVSAGEIASDESLADWRFVLGTLRADFLASSFAAGGALVAEIAALADDVDHHPDLSIRWPGRVMVTLSTHDIGGLSDADVTMAREISALASAVGASADRDRLQAIEFAICTMDAERIRPFWAAVLGYAVRGETVVDPAGVGPPLWFQQMDEPRTERGRFHLDISVPHDQAEARVAAAIEAGGTGGVSSPKSLSVDSSPAPSGMLVMVSLVEVSPPVEPAVSMPSSNAVGWVSVTV